MLQNKIVLVYRRVILIVVFVFRDLLLFTYSVFPTERSKSPVPKLQCPYYPLPPPPLPFMFSYFPNR